MCEARTSFFAAHFFDYGPVCVFCNVYVYFTHPRHLAWGMAIGVARGLRLHTPHRAEGGWRCPHIGVVHVGIICTHPWHGKEAGTHERVAEIDGG